MLLQPYKKLSVDVDTKLKALVWNDGKSKEPLVDTVINKGDSIELELYETEKDDGQQQFIAVIKVLPKRERRLDLKLTKDNDFLLSQEEKRVAKKMLETKSAVFNVQILNKIEETFYVDSPIYGGFFQSNGAKIIQLFTTSSMMDKEDFELSCEILLRPVKE